MKKYEFVSWCFRLILTSITVSLKVYYNFIALTACYTLESSQSSRHDKDPEKIFPPWRLYPNIRFAKYETFFSYFMSFLFYSRFSYGARYGRKNCNEQISVPKWDLLNELCIILCSVAFFGAFSRLHSRYFVFLAAHRPASTHTRHWAHTSRDVCFLTIGFALLERSAAAKVVQ